MSGQDETHDKADADYGQRLRDMYKQEKDRLASSRGRKVAKKAAKKAAKGKRPSKMRK